MKLSIVSVFDTKTGLYTNPSTCRHVGDAIRDFESLRKDPNNKFGASPSDYHLKQIGFFNDETGSLETITPPLDLVTGV